MNELKPCPFCGGKAEIVSMGVDRQVSVVLCEECGGGTMLKETEAEAIDAWNRRAE